MADQEELLSSPDKHAPKWDVVISSPFLKGFSMTTHFVTAFDFLFNNVLTFREELQMV